MSDKASTGMEFSDCDAALDWLASVVTEWPGGVTIKKVRQHQGVTFSQDIESGAWVAHAGKWNFSRRTWRWHRDALNNAERETRKPFESKAQVWCACGDGYQVDTAGAQFIREFGHCENCQAAEHAPADSAADIMEAALGHLQDRAATYDKQGQGGERSIGAAVEAFQAVTGDGVMDTAERGWLFMVLLKMVRTQQGGYRADNYEDATAYAALMGEAAAGERNHG